MSYIELVDWSGKTLRVGKASINNQSPPILEKLNLPQKDWLTACTQLVPFMVPVLLNFSFRFFLDFTKNALIAVMQLNLGSLNMGKFSSR
ncbi:hypothetical protein [Vibrio sp. VB16]|uniref:hypothetical protein n=1 Tax=Vibrio sp. VB16 TaxID=2785746 RepID=UPI00189DF817|nr:hypothetical protein [Vibrio sp. VB16]UGA53672.1 hypothetical protein IUZ65_010245 [Vibrio sp. VB16]